MLLSLIAAADEHNVIGKDGKLPWHLSADMHYFRTVTSGHPIIMGRKTYESIGHPLPGRQNIVISRQTHLKIDGCDVVSSLDEAIHLAEESGATEAFVIGGGEIYKQALSIADRIYLTRIALSVDGDTFFPVFSEKEWEEVSREEHQADEKNACSYTFTVYRRFP